MVLGNIEGFWNPMLTLIDHMKAEGFIHTAHLVRPLVVDKSEAIVAAILTEGSAVDAPTGGVSAVIDRM